MFHRFMGMIVLMALMLATTVPALAQDASPPAAAPRDTTLVRGLGLPEINLVATSTDLTGVPDKLAAGRYLVTLENQTADQEVEIIFSILPDGITAQQATSDLNEESDTVPSWVYDATFAGGPNAYPGQTDAVVVELKQADWWVAVDRISESGQVATDTALTLKITGNMPATQEIAGAVSVTMKEYAFEIPASIAAGPQIWHLTNTGKQPHFIVLGQVPAGTTFAQVMATLAFEFSSGGTPPADALAEGDFHDVYDSSFISAGESLWFQLNLEPGTYLAMCFFPDQDSPLQPHAMLGMVQLFDVA